MAAGLDVPFTDTDNGVEEKADLSVSAIFDEKGLEHFRTVEAEVINETVKSQPHVIATGGGAVLNPTNRNIFKEAG